MYGLSTLSALFQPVTYFGSFLIGYSPSKRVKSQKRNVLQVVNEWGKRILMNGEIKEKPGWK